MSIAAALIMLLQANTADLDAGRPLEAGRWVVRTSSERGTDLGGISASLMSDDGNYRLVVRCDFSYQNNISIQFMRLGTSVPQTATPVSLTYGLENRELAVEWESVQAGTFARDGDNDPSATQAARFLQGYIGELRVEARDQSGRSIKVLFTGAAGHPAIGRTIDACALPAGG